MKVATLLVLWTLPLLHLGGHDPSPCRGRPSGTHVHSLAIEPSQSACRPHNPSRRSFVSPLEEEEEEGLEDGPSDDGVLLSGSCPDPGQGRLSAFAQTRLQLPRISPCPHPLRC